MPFRGLLAVSFNMTEEESKNESGSVISFVRIPCAQLALSSTAAVTELNIQKALFIRN